MRVPGIRLTAWLMTVVFFVSLILIVALKTRHPLEDWHRLEATLEQSKGTGDRIVAQIERFHSDHGRYPERLDDLVPDYLPAIPRPGDGVGYFYSRKDEVYQLSFGFWFTEGIDLYPRCTWDSRDHAWHVDA